MALPILVTQSQVIGETKDKNCVEICATEFIDSVAYHLRVDVLSVSQWEKTEHYNESLETEMFLTDTFYKRQNCGHISISAIYL